MIEKNIQHNARITPAGMAKTRERLIDQGMGISEYINAAVQLYRRFDDRAVFTLQAAFDEVAIKTAEQFFRPLAAEVQMCEIIHAAQFSTATPISL